MNESALFISRYRVYKFFIVLSGWGRGGIPEKTLKLVSTKPFSQEQSRVRAVQYSIGWLLLIWRHLLKTLLKTNLSWLHSTNMPSILSVWLRSPLTLLINKDFSSKDEVFTWPTAHALAVPLTSECLRFGIIHGNKECSWTQSVLVLLSYWKNFNLLGSLPSKESKT